MPALALGVGACLGALLSAPRCCSARARAARAAPPRRSRLPPPSAVAAPRGAYTRPPHASARIAPPSPLPSARHAAPLRRSPPALRAAAGPDSARPYDELFGSAATVVAETCALPGGRPLLLLHSRTARFVPPDDDEDSSPSAVDLYAVDETVAEAAASMSCDAASAAAALLECQWATALAQHAAATVSYGGSSTWPLATVAGVAVAVGTLAAAETAKLRTADDAFRSGLEAQLAELGAPPGLAAASAGTGSDGAAWLSAVESALDLAESVEQDEVTWPGAAAVLLLGAASEDAALLTALNALLPRAAAAAAAEGEDSDSDGLAQTEAVAPDVSGALALAPWLEGACDRGLAAAARALGAAASPRVAENGWRMAVRFSAADAPLPRAPLLVVLLPVGADGDVAGEHAVAALRVAEARTKAKLPPPLLAAWGAPAAAAQGGAALRTRRDALAKAVADAIQAAAAKAA